MQFAAWRQPRPPTPERAEEPWIARSNSYTNLLLDVQLEHSPEQGSREGVAKFDERISNPTLADELAERHELEAVLVKIDAARAKEADKKVARISTSFTRPSTCGFAGRTSRLQHEVPFYNASEEVFQGLRGLLDDQVAPERRPAALVRLRKYAGVEPGYTPFTELSKQRELEQIAKPGVIYPSKSELETELGRNSNYVDGIAALFKKYKLTGWEPAYAETEGAAGRLRRLDARRTSCPRRAPTSACRRRNMRSPSRATASISRRRRSPRWRMRRSRSTRRRWRRWPRRSPRRTAMRRSDYRAVIAELKKKQITGEAILPFYREAAARDRADHRGQESGHAAARARPSSAWPPPPRRRNSRRRTCRRRRSCTTPANAANSCCR